MTDARPYCDHRPWVGPCSKEKHAAIVAGINPHYVGVDRASGKMVAPEAAADEMMRWAIGATRIEDDGVHCACCRQVLP